MASLKIGQPLRGITSGLACRVDTFIGEGGQGEVYRIDLDGKPYALKWYNDQVLRMDRGLRHRLQVAIDRGAPSAKFLWPFELASLPDGSRLGYLMPLRRPGYTDLHSLFHETVNPSFRTLATMGCLLTDALFALHAKGLAYRDLNAGNVFFDQASGDIEICDNDNVDVDGAPSLIGGVREFQAPEIVLQQASTSRATDLHSLAVMLFKLLHIGHPLRGKRELDHPNLASDLATRRLYGSEAKFVFDPADDSNRPLPELHARVIGYWGIYPEFLRELFIRAFTEGLFDPAHGRVQETEWRRAMSRLRDSVQTCPGCGAGNFYDAKRVVARQSGFACWGCAAELPSAPPRLGIRRVGARHGEAPAHVVVLDRGAQLFAHHTAASEIDYAAPTGILEIDADRVRLVNCSRSNWSATRHGESTTIAPEAAVELTNGLRIRFERTEGEIKMLEAPVAGSAA
jgi:eukaryotic-like serine/threonine-protein kinase